MIAAFGAALIVPCFARFGGHGAAGIIEPGGLEVAADLLHFDIARRPRLFAARRVQPDGSVVEEGADDIGPPIFHDDLLAADRAGYGEAD